MIIFARNTNSMKKTILFAVLLLITRLLYAQSPVQKGLQSINRETAESHVHFLASDELEGREAGTRGGTIAVRYIAAILKSIGIQPLHSDYYQPFEACRKERQQKGSWQIHPDSIASLKRNIHQQLNMQNVLGVIPGKRTREYVIVGAHFDHLGTDSLLTVDQIYNGADDNASGISAVLQIARAFLASGQQPERTVIFAFWDGEEKGLLGSRYFVETCPFVKQIKGYLNFDMIGRNNKPEHPRQFVYFYTEAYPVFARWLSEDIRKYNLQLEPELRPWEKPTGGSDNAPFALQNIPIIWYHTNGHPDYHQPSDHADKLNWEKITDLTKASFLNMWNLANENSY